MSSDMNHQIRLQRALRSRIQCPVDGKGYVRTPEENLVEGVSMAQFEADLLQGDGNELHGKFLAVHSSTALAVNTFAWFQHPERRALLSILGSRGAAALSFEKKCRIFRGGRCPHLDVWIEREYETIAIESKFTEYMDKSKAPSFSQAYDRLAPPEFAEPCWWRVYQRAKEAGPDYLDVAQLVKHYFGLRKHRLSNKTASPLRFLYLYWEPQNAHAIPACVEHGKSLTRLIYEVRESSIPFSAMTYTRLWNEWTQIPELRRHVETLKSRYDISA